MVSEGVDTTSLYVHIWLAIFAFGSGGFWLLVCFPYVQVPVSSAIASIPRVGGVHADDSSGTSSPLLQAGDYCRSGHGIYEWCILFFIARCIYVFLALVFHRPRAG